MARAAKADPEQELLAYLAKIAGSQPKVVDRKSWGVGLRIARCADYPGPGFTTVVTLGASRLPVSFYRGRDVGFELTLTMVKENPDLIETLAVAVRENLRLGATHQRRPFIEYNGVFAPGYPPHLLFTDHVTCTPALTGRKRFGEKYVSFLAAIPLNDRELREYDRNVPALIESLRSSGRVAEYPR